MSSESIKRHLTGFFQPSIFRLAMKQWEHKKNGRDVSLEDCDKELYAERAKKWADILMNERF